MMGISERVVSRFLVAAQQVRADSYGDPNELLKQYREHLARFASHEEVVKNYIHAADEIAKLKAQGPHTKAEQDRLFETHIMEVTRKDERGMTGRDRIGHIDGVIMYNGRTGDLGRTATKLCFALLQQLVLPPGVRKSIEAAAKWMDKGIRLPKAITWELTKIARANLYLELVENFRKYEKLFEQAIRVGKAHSAEGEGATRMTAGPFTVVNTGGFDAEKMARCAKLAIEASEKMHGIGLGKVCYGDMLMSNRLSAQKNNAAFYSPPQDEMFIRADIPEGADSVRVLCHELTHRLVNKFIPGKMNEIKRIYSTIKTHGFVIDNEMPRIGDPIEYKGKAFVVSDYDTKRNSIQIKEAHPPCFVCEEKGRAHHEPDEEHKGPIGRPEGYTLPGSMYYKLLGKEQKVDPIQFITPYANKGGPEENFCEMVAFYALGKLPKEQVDLLLPVLG